jgi:hypothetical protein
MNFRFGIEHEVAFVRPDGQFADFTNTRYEEFAAIVAMLPEYAEDTEHLRLGDAGIRRKRWYIEGMERFDQVGKMVDCIAKGIEIRTTIHDSIAGVIAQLQQSYDCLTQAAHCYGFQPILTSFNPHQTKFMPQPPFNAYEQRQLQVSPEDRTEHLAMLSYGPDLNLSVVGASAAQVIDWGQKLTYYSPFIIPFSFGESMYAGQPWCGRSVRTFYRTGLRPAVLVYVEQEQDLITSDPSLVKLAKIPAEVGRIEFKAFDSCAIEHYPELFVLLKGLLLDQTLTGRAMVPDRALHQRAAQFGFDDVLIYETACEILAALTKLTNQEYSGLSTNLPTRGSRSIDQQIGKSLFV